MLRLLLDGNEMDLYEDVSVNLTLQFSDVQNVNSPTGSFSQTFRIPATANNLDYLGAIDDTTAVDIVNVKQRIPAEILSDTIPILSGFCQVKAVYLQKERYADIELVFFGGAIDLKTALSGKMLTDIDLSAYDHLLNLTNVQQSWGSSGIAPEIRYGLIDKGFNWSSENPPWTDADGLWQGELTPFIQIKTVFDAIMADAGFTYDSDFFDTTGTGAFSEMYMPCLNGTASLSTDGQEDETCAMGKDGDRVGTYPLGPLHLKDDILNATDPSDNWTQSTPPTPTHFFTAPYTGHYKIRFKAKWSMAAGSAHFMKMYLYKNGSSVATLVDTTSSGGTAFAFPVTNRNYDMEWDDEEWNAGIVYGGLNTPYVYGQGFLLESGDTISIYRETNGTSTTIWGGGTNTPEVGKWHTTSLEVYEVGSPLSGQTITMSENLPDLSQLDFIVGLQRMFNLVFVPDKNKPNHLLIEPFTDYTSAGTTKDWTDKVDYSKDLTIRPTTDLQKQEYLWTYSEGKDFLSTSIQSALGRVYGRYRITEPDNDFAKGTQSIKPSFGQFLTTLIPGSTKAIHRSLMPDGTIVQDPLPMVAYWHGLSEQFGTWYLRDDSGTTGSGSAYFPSFSNYSTDFADITDKDLNYGMEPPFFPVTTNPVNTLYISHWAQYVAELYSDEARIMTCTMRLSKQELADFEFSDNIYLKDSYWRVLKINYDTNVEGTARVELIKILSDVNICEDTPTAWDERLNFIRFNSSTSGSPDFGSKNCCEFYGFKWMANTKAVAGVTPTFLCRPLLQTTPNTSDETS